jgi:pyrroline-5-carboxylate reductase
MAEEKHILLIGCGNMGQALLRGWRAKGYSPRAVRALDPMPEARAAARALGAEVEEAMPRNGSLLDIVVLAVKPQQLDGVLDGCRALVRPGLPVLSIVAGKRLSVYLQVLGPQAAVVRAMPNTPAAIGRGMTVLCPGPGVRDAQRALCTELMSAVGDVAWVEEESAMDAVTAVSGSGPAYVFLLIQSLAAAGVRAGLSEPLARQLAEATVAGAGAYALRSEEPAAELRRRVTSPGGTTEAALRVLLAEDGLPRLIERAVLSAAERSRELG